MKMKKYIKTITLALFLAFSFSIFAQNPNAQERKKWHEEFKVKKQEFITKNLDLTPSQSEAFFPVYWELQQKKMELQKKTRDQFSKIMDNPKDHTDKEYVDMANLMAQTKVKEAELELQDIKKFQKLIPAKAVMKLQLAELEFNKTMMQRGPGPNQRSNKNSSNSSDKSNKKSN